MVDKTRAEIKPASAGGNPQDPSNGKEAVHFAFPFNVPGGEIRMDIPWAVVQPEKDQMPGACKNWFTVRAVGRYLQRRERRHLVPNRCAAGRSRRHHRDPDWLANQPRCLAKER